MRDEQTKVQPTPAKYHCNCILSIHFALKSIPSRPPVMYTTGIKAGGTDISVAEVKRVYIYMGKCVYLAIYGNNYPISVFTAAQA